MSSPPGRTSQSEPGFRQSLLDQVKTGRSRSGPDPLSLMSHGTPRLDEIRVQSRRFADLLEPPPRQDARVFRANAEDETCDCLHVE